MMTKVASNYKVGTVKYLWLVKSNSIIIMSISKLRNFYLLPERICLLQTSLLSFSALSTKLMFYLVQNFTNTLIYTKISYLTVNFRNIVLFMCRHNKTKLGRTK